MCLELLPPWTTSNTPSTIVEISTPSVNELTGGESTTTCVYFACSAAISLRIWSDPSSSAGFGGIGPEVRTLSPLSSSLLTIDSISSSLTSLERIELSPSCPCMSKIDCRRGRRMSASMIATDGRQHGEQPRGVRWDGGGHWGRRGALGRPIGHAHGVAGGGEV